MKIILANPRGFCAGVDRAILIVNLALEQFKSPIYVRHEVVHNRFVVEDLKSRGAIFVEELDEVPDDSIVIFSAHGVSQQVREEAKRRQLKVFDATCPLVTKVHMQVHRASRRGEFVILIGHSGHPEVVGTMGQFSNSNSKAGIVLVETVEDVIKLEIPDDLEISFMSQTTLSVEDTKDIIAAIHQKYPRAQAPRKSDICYATTNRQEAVRMLAEQVDCLIVVGSTNSSNSTRLAELGNRLGVPSYLLDQVDMVTAEMVENVKVIGITAGASAPEVLVQSIIDKLRSYGVTSVENLAGITETTFFEVPKELKIKQLN